MSKAKGVQPNISPNTILKKFVHRANSWCVTWREIKDKGLVQHREFFTKEIDADNFIKNKKNEIQTKTQ